MLSDYANIIPSLIAIVNTVIAVWVSHFRPERNKLKVCLLIVAIVLGLLGAIATVYGQHAIIQRQEDDTRRRHYIHTQLGLFISEGDQLLLQLRDQNITVHNDDINMWVQALKAI